MNENIRRFVGDPHTKGDVLEYITKHLEKEIIKEAYKGGNVSSLATASLEIKKAFEQMDIEYAPRPEQPKQDNPAR